MLEWLFGRRKQLLKKEISLEERTRLDRVIWQASLLAGEQREQLIRWCRVFIAEKTWEGFKGVKITEELQWQVAAAAGLMVLSYPDWYFDKTSTILIHPQVYKVTVAARHSVAKSGWQS